MILYKSLFSYLLINRQIKSILLKVIFHAGFALFLAYFDLFLCWSLEENLVYPGYSQTILQCFIQSYPKLNLKIMFIQTIQENVNFTHPEQPQPLLHEKDKILFPTKQFFDEPMPNLKYFNYDIYSEDSQFSQFNQISNLNILRTQKQPPPLKIKINEKKKDADPLTKYILEDKRFYKKNNNTVRFLVDLVVENLPKFADQYSEDEKQKILQLCSKERAWHLSKKKNVYNFDHLKLFFSDNARQPNAQKTRQIFSKILREESIKSMKRPKSQIHDKIHYLRVVKIFNLRCRNQILSLRNQYR